MQVVLSNKWTLIHTKLEWDSQEITYYIHMNTERKHYD